MPAGLICRKKKIKVACSICHSSYFIYIMSNTKLVSIDKIYRYLDEAEPYEDMPVNPLTVFSLNGVPYKLHVDVNNQGGKYGFMWEWWLSNPGNKFIDGGFEPANSEGEVTQLAALIHSACSEVLQQNPEPGSKK